MSSSGNTRRSKLKAKLAAQSSSAGAGSANNAPAAAASSASAASSPTREHPLSNRPPSPDTMFVGFPGADLMNERMAALQQRSQLPGGAAAIAAATSAGGDELSYLERKAFADELTMEEMRRFSDLALAAADRSSQADDKSAPAPPLSSAVSTSSPSAAGSESGPVDASERVKKRVEAARTKAKQELETKRKGGCLPKTSCFSSCRTVQTSLSRLRKRRRQRCCTSATLARASRWTCWWKSTRLAWEAAVRQPLPHQARPLHLLAQQPHRLDHCLCLDRE